jgi:hypothetical protein
MKIKLSKTQWTEMGKKAGWMKKAQSSPIDAIIDQVENLLQQENTYKENTNNIEPISEPDYDEIGDNFVPGMSAEDYKQSLVTPSVDILYAGQQELKVYFIGNNAPNSVNAGTERKVFLDLIPLDLLEELKTKLMPTGIDVEISENAQRAYSKRV